MASYCSFHVWLLVLCFICAPAVVGCSGNGRPALGHVEGEVTLDNKPLANATVSFKPQTGKRSVGITNQGGHYELFYIRDIKVLLLAPTPLALLHQLKTHARKVFPLGTIRSRN